MIAYFDYNIFTSIAEGDFGIYKISEKVDQNITSIPFSAAHIQEVDNIIVINSNQRQLEIRKRCNIIRQITNGLYIYHDFRSNKVYFLKENPLTVLETIRQIPYAKPAMQSFVNLITSEQKSQLRTALGIKSIEINNYQPDEVVDHLNSRLNMLGFNETFLGLIEKAVEIHPDGKSFGLDNRIAGLFELLDMLGYWKDKATKTSNYARLWDSNHTYFASFCDYFISDDKRTRNKAKVAYKIYDIQTVVLSSDGKE